MHHHALLIFKWVVETGSHYIAQAAPKLLSSSDPPTSASQSARINRHEPYRAWPMTVFIEEETEA